MHGQVQIQNGQNLVQILQQTPQAIINWGQFNIGLGETVRFLQPSQQAAILNRVTGVDPSVIQGTLQANGRVFLLNPNGILFGPNSVVDVGSFTASTLKMADEDFLNGTYKLTQDGTLPLAALTNQGSIRVADGGFVVLVSPLLDNQGMIVAQSGHVQLGATTQATFSVDGRGQVLFAVPDGFDPQFTGGGKGGTVLLQPGQMNQLLTQVVSNPLLVEAGSFSAGANGQNLAHGAEGLLLNSGTIQADGGTIRLDSSGASVHSADGQLQAEGGDVRLLSAGSTVSLGSVQAGPNGFAEISGKQLWLDGPVRAGTILLDPFNIEIIDAAGGSLNGSLPTVSGGTGSGQVSVGQMTNLGGTVLLDATNDVFYSGTGFNLGSTLLTVRAGNDINFQTSGSPIQASALDLQAGRNVTLTAQNNGGLIASNGVLRVIGGQNVNLQADGDLLLGSPTLTTISATNQDLSLSSAMVFNGYTTFLNGGGNFQFSAGRDLTMSNPNLTQNTPAAVSLIAGQDLRLQDNNNGQMSAGVGSLTVQAGRDFIGRARNGTFSVTTQAGGALDLVAGRDLSLSGTSQAQLLSGGSLGVRGQTVTANSPTLVLKGASGAVVNATSGSVSLTASSGNLEVSSSAGRVAVNSTVNTGLQAGSDLIVNSATATRVEAGNDVTLGSSNSVNGYTTFINSPDTLISAGHDLVMSQPNLTQNSSIGSVSLTAGNDLRIVSPNSSVSASVGSLAVQAGRNLSGQPAGGSFTLSTSSAAGLNLAAGRNLTLAAPSGSLLLQANGGPVRVSGSNVSLSAGSTVDLNGSGEVVVNATNGDLRLSATSNNLRINSSNGRVAANATNGDLVMNAGGDLILNSATATGVNGTRDISLNSALVNNGFSTFLNSPNTQVAAGRNLTLNQPNLRHTTLAGPVTLSAGRDVAFTSPNGGIDVQLHTLTVQAGGNVTASPANGGIFLRGSSGDATVTAGGNISLDATNGQPLEITAPSAVRLSAQDIRLNSNQATLRSGSELVVNATNGNVQINGSTNNVDLNSSNGRVAVNATNGDVSLTAGGDIFLRAGTSATINATRDVNLSSSLVQNGFTTFLNNPDTRIGAGRNLTMNQPNLTGGSAAVTLTAGNDVRLSSTNSGVSADLGSLQVEAGRDLIGVPQAGGFGIRAGSGNLALEAGRNVSLSGSGGGASLTAPSGAVRVTGSDVRISGTSNVISGATGTTVNATGGDVQLSATGGSNLEVRGGTGAATVNASNDVVMTAGGDIYLTSTQNQVKAGRDLSATSATINTGYTTFVGGSTTMEAGRNLTLSQPNLTRLGNDPVVLRAGEDIVLKPTNGNLNIGLQSLDAQAGGDLRTEGPNMQITTLAGLRLAATGNLTFAPGGLNNQSGPTTLSGGNVVLNNVGLVANNGETTLSSTGNLSVGTLNTNVNTNTTLTGANIAIQSMQLISGGNYTISTPGNLTEATPATNPPTLSALHIEAGRAFGLTAGNSSFSIPRTSTPGNLTGLVTGGNDTVFHASASFQNFNTANFQPSYIDFQTGDIYVDGELYYGGKQAPIAPPNPPSPPPTPDLPVVPIPPTAPVVPPVIAEVRNDLSAEQRSQILAQSNLALGNLGSFSRVLSEEERERLTSRHDALHQTWALDPFSPTLALTLPGGPPAVYPSELAGLEALLLSSGPSEEVEEKTRAAYNVIVDQELREIWEVRYWRHLLENFILWEDRE